MVNPRLYLNEVSVTGSLAKLNEHFLLINTLRCYSLHLLCLHFCGFSWKQRVEVNIGQVHYPWIPTYEGSIHMHTNRKLLKIQFCLLKPLQSVLATRDQQHTTAYREETEISLSGYHIRDVYSTQPGWFVKIWVRKKNNVVTSLFSFKDSLWKQMNEHTVLRDKHLSSSSG